MSAANLIYEVATIASGESTSNGIDITRGLLGSITCPSDLEGLATLKILTSNKIDGVYTGLAGTLNSGATDFTVTLTASKTIPLDTSFLVGIGFIKLEGDTNATGNIEFTLNYKQAS